VVSPRCSATSCCACRDEKPRSSGRKTACMHNTKNHDWRRKCSVCVEQCDGVQHAECLPRRARTSWRLGTKHGAQSQKCSRWTQQRAHSHDAG
jgi:hypothetical protein